MDRFKAEELLFLKHAGLSEISASSLSDVAEVVLFYIAARTAKTQEIKIEGDSLEDILNNLKS